MKTKKPNTISFWNPRGGQGKSLLAAHCVHYLYKIKNYNVTAISSDPYSHLSLMHKKNSFFTLLDSLDSNITSDICIIDHSNDNDIPHSSDFIIIPSKTNTPDYLSLASICERIKSKKEVLVVFMDCSNTSLEFAKNNTSIPSSHTFSILRNDVFEESIRSSTTIFDNSFDTHENIDNVRNVIISIVNYIFSYFDNEYNAKNKDDKVVKKHSSKRVLKAMRITKDRALVFGRLAVQQKIDYGKTEQDLADEAIDLLIAKYSHEE